MKNVTTVNYLLCKNVLNERQNVLKLFKSCSIRFFVRLHMRYLYRKTKVKFKKKHKNLNTLFGLGGRKRLEHKKDIERNTKLPFIGEKQLI